MLVSIISIKMCLATVERCENCQSLSCRKLEVCSDAQQRGMIHITRQAYESARTTSTGRLQVDVFGRDNDKFFMEIYPIMEQKQRVIPLCNLFDDATLSKAVTHTGQCCNVSHIVCKNSDKHGNIPVAYGPLKLCDALHNGTICIRKDAYNKAQNGKVSVSVCPEFLKTKIGHLALVYEQMEGEMHFSGLCWLCKRK